MTTTTTMELQPRADGQAVLADINNHGIENAKYRLATDADIAAATAAGEEPRAIDTLEAAAPSPAAVPSREKWNSSRKNILKLAATFGSFVLIGANDAAYGVRDPR